MNYARPPWDNINARMAISKAIDRQAFVDSAFFGLAIPAVGAIAPAFGWAYLPPTRSKTRRHSIWKRRGRWPRRPASSERSRS